MNTKTLDLVRDYASALQEIQRLNDQIGMLKIMIDREEKANLAMDMKYKDAEKVSIRGSIDTEMLKNIFGFNTSYGLLETLKKFNGQREKAE